MNIGEKRLDEEFNKKLKRWNKEYKKSAKEIGVSLQQYMRLLTQNELIQINKQLSDIHEHVET